VIDDLLAQLPTARATWVLILTGLTGIAFSLSAFACDRLGHTIISPFLAAGAWLCAAFGALVWFWR
jgi:cytochrome b subunit of formate dehydrogenase